MRGATTWSVARLATTASMLSFDGSVAFQRPRSTTPFPSSSSLVVTVPAPPRATASSAHRALVSSSSLTTRWFSSSSDDVDDEPTTTTTTTTTATTTTLREPSKAASSRALEMREQARLIRAEAERMETTVTLEKVSLLETKLKTAIRDKNDVAKNELRLQIEQLAKRADPTFVPRSVDLPPSLPSPSEVKESKATKEPLWTVSTSTSPKVVTITVPPSTNSRDPLTPTELFEACGAFRRLPPQIRAALAQVVGESDPLSQNNDHDDDDDDDEKEDSSSVVKARIEGVVSKLWFQQDALLSDDDERLARALRLQLTANDVRVTNTVEEVLRGGDLTELLGSSDERLENLDVTELLESLRTMDDSVADVVASDRFVESSLPPQTRKEGRTPSYEDAEAFLNTVLLDTKRSSGGGGVGVGRRPSLVFSPTATKPELVPGGYVLRGVPGDESLSAAEIVEAIDETFRRVDPERFERLNFYYLEDPTGEVFDGPEVVTGRPVLLLTGRDLSPSASGIVQAGITTLCFGLLFLFCLGLFSGNDLVMGRLAEANNNANNGDLNIDWFNNDLLSPLLFSLLGTQFAHEAAHLVASNAKGFKQGAPTFLPALSLPFYGCVTPVKTSPPDLDSLFDFAAAGPIVGLITSLLLLHHGLDLTLAADPTTDYALFPSVPLDALRGSALGGTLVNAALAGNGLSVDDGVAASVPLHPSAVGGYFGLVVNALSLLPFGNTDGGRMSQTLFGRTGHSVVQAAAYAAVFLSFLFGADQSDALLGYALTTNFFQNRKEIPCRNEVDRVSLSRAFVALLLWFTAALTLLPMDHP